MLEIFIQAAAAFGPLILTVMGVAVSIRPPMSPGRARWAWVICFVLVGLPTAASIFIELRGTDTVLAKILEKMEGRPITAGDIATEVAKILPSGEPAFDLTEAQTRDFLEHASSFKIEAHGFIPIFATCGNATQRYAGQLADLLTAANIGRMYQRGHCTPHDIPTEKGLLVLLKEFNKPSPEAQQMMNILTASKIPFSVSRVILTNMNQPYFAFNVVGR